MKSISICVVTKNEEHNIVDCLNSVKEFADEIIVIDSASTDRTVELCQQFTDKIIVTPWKGCGPQKQQAVSMATSDWVLILDADERVTPALAAEIKQVLQHADHNGYEIPFKSYYCGKQIRFGDWMHEKHLRLFKRDKCEVIPRLVHFGLQLEGPAGQLKGHMLHYSFPSVESVIKKMDRYSSDGAQHFYAQQRATSAWSAFAHGLFTFVRGYILRFGFLDGRHGLMLAISNAEGSYYKYIKLLELQSNAAQSSGA